MTNIPGAKLLRIIVAFLLALVTGVGAGVSIATPAQAAVGFSRGPGYSIDGSMVGYWKSGSDYFICLDTHAPWPNSIGSGTDKGTPQVAYLMAKYLRGSATDVEAAALAVIVKDRYDDRSTAWAHLRKAFFAAGHSSVKTKITQMLAEATQYAGPYKITPVLNGVQPAPGAPTTTATVTNIGVLSSSGAFMAQEANGTGYSLTVAISGNSGATFADGTTTKTLSSSGSSQSLNLINISTQPDGAGNAKTTAVTVSTAAKFADTTFIKHASSPSTAQNMSEGHTVSVPAGSVTQSASTTAAPYNIKIGSQVRQAYLAAGQVAHDLVRVDGDWPSGAANIPADPRVTIRSTLYGPFATQPERQPTVPAGATQVGQWTVTRSFAPSPNGLASPITTIKVEEQFTSPALAQPGYYVWVEQAYLNQDPANTLVGTDFGRSWEINYVADPKVTSQASTFTEEGTTTFSDSVTVSGFKTIAGAGYFGGGLDMTSENQTSATWHDLAADTNLRLSGRLLGPMDPVAGTCSGVDWAGAPTALSIPNIANVSSAVGATTDASGSVTFNGVGQFVNPEIGKCYTYTYDFTVDTMSVAPDYSGAVTYYIATPVTSVISAAQLAGDPAETLIAYRLDSQVDSDMLINDGTAGETSGAASTGLVSHDTVRIQGLPAGVTIPITSTLYGPIRIVDGGDQSTAYAEGDDTKRLIDAPVESWVFPTANPQLAPVVQTFTQNVTGDGTGDQTITFDSPELTADGWYVWVEGSAGNPAANLSPYETSFGRSTESVAVVTPTITTRVSEQRVVGNRPISDSVTVTGIDLTRAVFAAHGSGWWAQLSGSVYGPMSPVNGTCKTVDWSKSPSFPLAPQVVFGDGTINDFGTFTPGEERTGQCYTYAETLTFYIGDAMRAQWTVQHLPGKESETTLITLPRMTTQTSAAVVGVGAQITDKVTVTGMNDTAGERGNVGIIQASLFGPIAAPSGGCSAITTEKWLAAVSSGSVQEISTDDLPIAGNGTFDTAAVTVPATGCWTWYERLIVGDPADPDYVSDTVQSGEFGVARETTLVIQPAVSTVAHVKELYDGTKLTDDVIVTGLGGQPGTVTGTLYGPVAKNTDDTCVNLNWVGAPVAGQIDPMKVVGDGTYTTAPITVTKAGCYTFVEQLTSDVTAVPVVNTQPGEATETVWANGGGGRQIVTGLDNPAGPSWVLIAIAAVLVAAGVTTVAARARRNRSGRVPDEGE